MLLKTRLKAVDVFTVTGNSSRYYSRVSVIGNDDDDMQISLWNC